LERSTSGQNVIEGVRIRMLLDGRLGAGPISWGVCEVPGWGLMLPADRVLDEMRSLGITATELGAPGFLPDEPRALAELLDRHGMSLIGGFVPVVMHDRSARDDALAGARETAQLFASAGASVFVSTAVVDARWSAPFPLSDDQWSHLVGVLEELDAICADHGLSHVLHPHAGTLVETRADVDVVLERSSVRLCLDTGHLTLGGVDPVAFARAAGVRVGHVHLKDVRAGVAARLAAREITFVQAIAEHLFCPLGAGDAPIAATIDVLEHQGYTGWYVLEQDTDLGDAEPAPGSGPVIDVRTSVEFLRSVMSGQRAG
jgi:inosose dehydratase